MTVEQLRRVQSAKPFQPYRLLLADGTKLPVPHPEYLLPHPTAGRTIAVAASDGTFHIIDLLLVAAIKVGNRGRGTGQSRKRRA